MGRITARPLSADEHQLVSAAVAEAEHKTDGEIVTIVADCSDHYADIPLFWAGGVTLLVLSLFAAFPTLPSRLAGLFAGGWIGEASDRSVLLAVFGCAVLVFLLVWLALQWLPLRLLLTPRDIKTRRTREHAVALFRVAVEGRTRRRTGVLIYLSLREHRAEIVADAAITAKVAPEAWGDMMAGMIAEVRKGRTGRGMATAVRQAGDLLAIHVPKQAENPNELPDRLIEI